ncbi:MAG: hypothetical protein HGA62_06850 [Chlorobiaceae bacterium]|nr:hypothetical protein [Chlorobiaceae bacterium]NTV61856.1 hypothetical protein [Chlorobiaceae bacterium]
MNEDQVGEWQRSSTGLHEFAYDESWHSSPISRAVSLSKPLREL